MKMFGSEMLEVAIGIIFIYMLVSVICTAIREGIEAWLKSRAAYLEYGIRELLHDIPAQGIANSLYNHPLVYSLFSGNYTPGGSSKPAIFARGAYLPSYIPTKNFAQALMDIAARGPHTNAASSGPNAAAISLDSMRVNIQNIDNEAVQRALLTAIDAAQGDLSKAQANIEAWYDSAMDRVSGWYKRSTQWIILGIGLAIAIGLNINTITIVDFLYRDEAVRSALVKQVEIETADPRSTLKYEDAKKEINSASLSLPIGWSDGWKRPRQGVWYDWVVLFLGWLMTAFAATMGAPFWFDMLNKVMVIRSTVKPHEKSPEEASEDRQRPAATSNVASVDVEGEHPLSPQPIDGRVPTVTSENFPNMTDPEGAVNGCDDVEFADFTPDEELPAAKGGVE
jgi:hypothetical protein